MSGFSAGWLALREPYDLRARNAAVLEAVTEFAAGKPTLGITDLASGTGSTLRALAPHIKQPQHWRLADNDLGLLARVPKSSPPGLHITSVPADLNRDLEMVLSGAIDLVTTSALLDLVSEEWLNRLAMETALRRLPVYAALSYDGRAELSPPDPLDARIVRAVNRHQRTDKGFGPALGPGAAGVAVAAFERLGYSTVHGSSDWEFGPADREIQEEILTGWAAAAREMGDPPLSETDAWLKRRRECLAAGRHSMRIGHADFFARLAPAR